MLKIIVKMLELVSKKLAAKFVFSLFQKTNPSKVRKIEQRILDSVNRYFLQSQHGKVAVYRWGKGRKTVVLVHGWNARATRFYRIINALRGCGYQVIAFDIPGHGESDGKTATLMDCREILLQLQKEYGEFEAVVSHSLGSLYSFYALNNGVRAKKLVAISSVCKFNYLTFRFCSYFGLKKKTIGYVNKLLEGLFTSEKIWEVYSSDYNAKNIESDVYLIHDSDDDFVELGQSKLISDSINGNNNIYVTNGLGHFRILSDDEVVAKVLEKITYTPLKKGLISSLSA
jgi:pimeloyl-ACP methyl ester carboxylesterase